MTVIRDAVIRIRTERSGSVGGGYESRAFAAEARAAKEASREIEGANQSLGRHSEAVGRFGSKAVKEFAQAGQGAVQLARAFALLAVSSEQDAQRIVQGLVQIEAAVSGVNGAYKLLSSTVVVQLAAALNPVQATLMVVGTLAIAGAAAWKYWGDTAQDAANRATRSAIESAKAYQSVLAGINQIRRAEMDRRMADEGFASENAITPAARRQALERQRTSVEGELSANEKRRTDLAAMDLTGQPRGVVASQTRLLADTEKTTLELLKEKAQVERDLLDLRKQERQEALVSQQGFGKSISDLFGGAAGSVVSDAAKKAADADIKKFEREAQVTIDKLNNVFQQVNQTLEKHEKDLRTIER